MNPDKEIFDKEYVAKPIIFLKDIGRYCQAVGCKKHLFGRPNQRFCSNKCRWKNNAQKNPPKEVRTIHCNIDLQIHGITNKYRTVKVYLKKGVNEEVKITPHAKELWELLDKIAEFRDIKKPLVELTA